MSSLEEQFLKLFEEDTREDLRQCMYLNVDLFVESAPVRSGRFRGSLLGYRGEVTSGEGLPANQPAYAPPGHDLVDTTLEGWRVGEEAGFVDQVPYAERLAEGYSPQAEAGWTAVIAAQVTERKG